MSDAPPEGHPEAAVSTFVSAPQGDHGFSTTLG